MAGAATASATAAFPWSHDYPDGEVHFSKILEELTLLRIRTDGSNILSLDDPELFNYPVAYMAEPGYWGVTPKEAVAFRSYLLKGGFVIFDDFRGQDWDNLQYQMKVVLPEANWVQLDGTALRVPLVLRDRSPGDARAAAHLRRPVRRHRTGGCSRTTIRRRRLMAVANVNNDISEYLGILDTGVSMVDLTNEAYKFGVNYVIYGLTH